MRKVFVLVVFFLFTGNSQIFAADVVINEFLPKPSESNPEWVEFYNTSTSAIDISDYFFDDDTDFNSDTGSSNKVAISGLLGSQSTCYWELSTYLNNNGDTPTLFKTDGTVVDSYQYTQTSTDKTYARVPDGGSWQANQTPTKSSNRCLDLVPTPTITPSPTITSTPTATPTLTPKPTNTPTATPTLSPTAVPTSTIAPRPTVKPSPTQNVQPPDVLGESITKPTEVLKEENTKQKETGVSWGLLIFLLLAGSVCMVGAAVLSIRQKRKKTRP